MTLTNKEQEILQLIMEEKSSQEIADVLNISIRTVETHRKRILKKTNTSNLVSLTLYALRNNLYDHLP